MGSSQTFDGSKGPQRSLSPTEFKPLIAAALPMIRMESPTPKQSRPKSVVNIDMTSLESSSSKTNLQRRSKLTFSTMSYTCTLKLLIKFYNFT